MCQATTVGRKVLNADGLGNILSKRPTRILEMCQSSTSAMMRSPTFRPIRAQSCCFTRHFQRREAGFRASATHDRPVILVIGDFHVGFMITISSFTLHVRVVTDLKLQYFLVPGRCWQREFCLQVYRPSAPHIGGPSCAVYISPASVAAHGGCPTAVQGTPGSHAMKGVVWDASISMVTKHEVEKGGGAEQTLKTGSASAIENLIIVWFSNHWPLHQIIRKLVDTSSASPVFPDFDSSPADMVVAKLGVLFCVLFRSSRKTYIFLFPVSMHMRQNLLPVLTERDTNTAEEDETDFIPDQSAYSDETCALDQACLEETSDGYKTVVQAPSGLFKFIIGRKGETKQRLEVETRTKIRIPRQGQEGDIVIQGHDKQGVTSAKTRIEVLLDSGRQKTPFTHFLSVPFNTQTLQDSLVDFKNDVLRECDGTPTKLHLTIGCLVLLNNEEVTKAGQLLQECQHELIILQSIADRLVDRFETSGLLQRDHDRVKLHVTVMNTIFRKDPTGAGYDFGGYEVKNIHISQRHSVGKDGYYTCAGSIELQ
ncbi:ASCC1-like protein [Mya arenaria]|uniref:ASCC1-like protein n=1 Tax=Mya arenaria TaxID=6604 RepID=A0ABY7G2I3_MYAAR|nr:ASCC1-like protein [Mya arenaria]